MATGAASQRNIFLLIKPVKKINNAGPGPNPARDAVIQPRSMLIIWSIFSAGIFHTIFLDGCRWLSNKHCLSQRCQYGSGSELGRTRMERKSWNHNPKSSRLPDDLMEWIP